MSLRKKISELATAATLTGAELLAGVQVSSTVSFSLNTLKAFVLSAYAGASSIVTTGLVTSGTWNSAVQKRVTSITSSATPTPSYDTTDQYNVIRLAVNAVFGAPTGTPTKGQPLVIRVLDNGSSHTIGFDAVYRAIGVTLPTSTTPNKTMYLFCIYNSEDVKLDIVDVKIQA